MGDNLHSFSWIWHHHWFSIVSTSLGAAEDSCHPHKANDWLMASVVRRYAYMDKNAVSDVNCESHLPRRLSFPFVAGFTISVAIINQAKWTQMPLMMFISLCGYVVNWRASVYFKGASTISSTLGALTVGKRHRLLWYINRDQC